MKGTRGTHILDNTIEGICQGTKRKREGEGYSHPFIVNIRACQDTGT